MLCGCPTSKSASLPVVWKKRFSNTGKHGSMGRLIGTSSISPLRLSFFFSVLPSTTCTTGMNMSSSASANCFSASANFRATRRTRLKCSISLLRFPPTCTPNNSTASCTDAQAACANACGGRCFLRLGSGGSGPSKSKKVMETILSSALANSLHSAIADAQAARRTIESWIVADSPRATASIFAPLLRICVSEDSRMPEPS
mmetsp:Transcript_101963/g.227766  ORF Transcript_101963/g.227766 Transcript_101963/m.227766 type:complete len:201 (-) Transcript_101963:188-790(-)